MLERRDSARVRTDDQGLILVAGRRPVICRLANRSGSGVWLWVPSGVDVPDSFRLTLPATGEAMHLDVVWRRSTEIAARIAFELAPDIDFAMPLAA